MQTYSPKYKYKFTRNNSYRNSVYTVHYTGTVPTVPVMKHKKIVTKLYDNIYEDNYFIKVTVSTIACRTTELEKNIELKHLQFKYTEKLL